VTLLAGELALARSDFETTLLTETCTIRRVVRTQTDSGGYTEVWSDAATVACRIGQPSTRELQLGGAMAEDADAIARLPALTDIRGADRLVRGSDTFEVMGAPVTVTDELIRSVFVRRA
jgi:head-tail adaptor